MPNLSFEDVQPMIDADLLDAEGSKVGKIEDIYLDNDTQQPAWALVHTGLLGRKLNYVPLMGASVSGDSLQAAYAESQIKDAPSIDPDLELSPEEEAQLYRHYGVDAEPRVLHAGDVEAAPAPDTGHDTSGPTTEDVKMTVPVQREEVRVVREPVADANVGAAMSGPELSEEEHEMTLMEEEVVVDKQVVPKERVRLDKSVNVEEEIVSEQVRKEQIDLEQQ